MPKPLPRKLALSLIKVRHSLFAFKIERLVEFTATVEHSLRRDAQRRTILTELDARGAHLDAEYLESVAEDLEVLQSEYPGLLRSSLIVMLYAVLEDFLHAQCCLLQRALELRIAPTDIAGKGIERSRSYLKKVIGADFPDGDPSWSQVTLLRELRNAIVHAGARVPVGLRRQLERCDVVAIDPAQRLSVLSGAIEEFAHAVLSFERRLRTSIHSAVAGSL